MINSAIKRRFPSTRGVVPPLLRAGRQINSTENVDKFFEDLFEFIDNFGYEGEYHNIEHFRDISIRFIEDLKYLSNQYPGEFSENDFLLAQIFAYGHDCVHNAKRKDMFILNIESICQLYGFETNERNLELIRILINEGIAEDNDLSTNNRIQVFDFTSNIDLSEEEMSAIVVDAFAFKNGISLETRYAIFGMIQATELKRSIEDDEPGFKWPRTQLELMAKLSDIGNFADPLEQWIDISNKVNVEVPWFTGSCIDSFIDEEFHFLITYVVPTLDIENRPLVEIAPGTFEIARVPDYYETSLVEAFDYLVMLKKQLNEIVANGTMILDFSDRSSSKELREFAEQTRQSLAKNNPELIRPGSPLPLLEPKHVERTL